MTFIEIPGDSAVSRQIECVQIVPKQQEGKAYTSMFMRVLETSHSCRRLVVKR